MVVTLCGCHERTYPLFSQASVFVWHDGACVIIWRIAIIPRSSPFLPKTTFFFCPNPFAPIFLFSWLTFCHFSFVFTILSCLIFMARGLALSPLLESFWDLPVGPFSLGKLYSGTIYSCGFVHKLGKLVADEKPCHFL